MENRIPRAKDVTVDIVALMIKPKASILEDWVWVSKTSLMC